MCTCLVGSQQELAAHLGGHLAGPLVPHVLQPRVDCSKAAEERPLQEEGPREDAYQAVDHRGPGLGGARHMQRSLDR
eukprot:5217572-Alexandrium_andersonii.AAC.1